MRRLFALILTVIVLALVRQSAAQTEPPRQRPRRESPPQKQVDRTIEYFAGRWRLEYIGGEFPPLSRGSRTGMVTFSRVGTSNFASGALEGELLGKPYRETYTIAVDPDTQAVVMAERRDEDGMVLISLGNWRSPLAIVFRTEPLISGHATQQLRRVISIRSEVAFDVTDEFSVNGGPFKRLGNGHYTKLTP